MPDPPRTTLPAFAPVPRRKQRADGWTAARQRRFIEALAETGSVKSAARAVGKTPETAYYLRRQPGAEEFRQAWEVALDLGIQRIEDVAMDRALNGVEQPVFAYGEFVGTRRTYNDQLLMFMLRNRAPHRFAGDRAGALSGSDKQTLARLKKQWREEWERDARLLALAQSKEQRRNSLASLTAKLERMRANQYAAMSPETRRLKALFDESFERDRASGYPWKNDDEDPHGEDPEPLSHSGPTRAQIPYLPGYPRHEAMGPPTYEDWCIARDPFGAAARNKELREKRERKE